MVAAEAKELFPYELGDVAYYNRVGGPEAMDDVREECCRLLGFDVGKGADLDPLREFVKSSCAFCRGSTRSNPHTAKGQVIRIICRACASICICFA
jgi:hypothetical protein